MTTWKSPGQAFRAILGFYVVVIVMGGLVGLVLPVRFGDGIVGGAAPNALLGAASALAASALWAGLKWRSWRAQGWPGGKAGAAGFARGLGVGVAMAAMFLGSELALGGIRVQLTGQSSLGAYVAFVPALVGWLAVAALAEELVFRGYPLARLADEIGPVAAAVVLAAGFAIIHGFNPGIGPLALINVALASLALSAAFFAWGGLPAAWGLHLGWNAGLVLVSDAPLSGISIGVPGFRYLRAGPDWLSGGAFGPEGGIVASLVMVLATLFLGRRVLVPLSREGEGAGVRVAAA